MSAGKGDGSRPFSVPWDEFAASHDAIFKCAVCGEKKSKCVCMPTDDGPGQSGEVKTHYERRGFEGEEE